MPTPTRPIVTHGSARRAGNELLDLLGAFEDVVGHTQGSALRSDVHLARVSGHFVRLVSPCDGQY